MKEYLLRTIVIILSLAGFLLASYINNKKKKQRPLVCPLKSNCDSVINSDYSRILGIKLEVLGIVYYTFIAMGYGILNLFIEIPFNALPNILLVISFFAFIFSLYLISVQAFVLRQWCTWCLVSALFCTLIFILSFIAKLG